MPTYSYICDACGQEFEREQRISEAPVKKCPNCAKNKARRMIINGNFILKGSGWYSDGYSSSRSKSSVCRDNVCAVKDGDSSSVSCKKSDESKKADSCSSCAAGAK